MSPSSISMYTCGPTTYDFCHVGNLRALLSYDVLKRVFRLLFPQHSVNHVCNLTDVDDKIITSCRKQSMSDISEVTAPVIASFFRDCASLNILPATSYPKASDYIEEVAALVETLQSKGLAYSDPVDGSVYFNVSRQEGYGTKLANLQAETTFDKLSSSRDFCLWKSFRPSFDLPSASWSPRSLPLGRPGWHIECSAMCRHLLGPQIDVHCGGVDLRFPHHENEIAQCEGAAGDGKQFCNYWVHNEFMQIGPRDDKMSKSKGNSITLSEACPTNIEKRAFRYLVVSSHYRSPLAFSSEALAGAVSALRRLDAAYSSLSSALSSAGAAAECGTSSFNTLSDLAATETTLFLSAVADDVSTPKASACIFSVVKAVEQELAQKRRSAPLNVAGLHAAKRALEKMDEVFGVLLHNSAGGAENKEEDCDPPEVKALVADRASAKEMKDWRKADELRSQIQKLGYEVRDVKESPSTSSQIVQKIR